MSARGLPQAAANVTTDLHRTVLWPLFGFTLAGAMVSIVGEIVKNQLVWYVRATDWIELLATTPLYLASLVVLHELFVSSGARRALRWAFLALALVFLAGQAMHFTANAINTFSTEVRDYAGVLPVDTYQLIYFLDETLSHLIIYTTRYSLFACLLALEVRHLAAGARPGPQWAALVLGLLFALWETLVFVEGQKVYLAPLLAAGLGALWLWYWWRSGRTLVDFARTGPVTAFVAVLLPVLLFGLVVYRLATGGMDQPSQSLGLWLA